MILDEYQRKASSTEKNNTLIVAPPGSGKTEVIINRIKYLIDKIGVNPKNIIVLTFTKAAAANMKKRFNAHGQNEPFFGTFHSLFYKILKRYKNVKIIDESIIYRIVSRILIKHAGASDEETVKNVVNSISLYRSSFQNIDDFNTETSKSILIECLKKYEVYKKENDLMDFDDLQIEFRSLISKNSDIRKNYSRRFKYILIDEFQDCDSIQIDILKILNNNGSSIFAVGDEDQCIYSFRGSRPDIMVDFDKVFERGTKMYLKTNYRCAKNIIDISRNLIGYNLMRNSKEIRGHKESDGIVKVIECENETDEAFKISDIIKKENGKNMMYENDAVLYRTNEESRSIAECFIKEDIPFRFIDKGYDVFSHFICSDLLSYLRLSVDNRDFESFKRIVNKPNRGISRLVLERMRNSFTFNDVFESAYDSKIIKSSQMRELSILERKISKIEYKNMKTLDAVNYILKKLKYLEYLKEYSKKNGTSMKVYNKIIEEFEEEAQKFQDINEFLNYVYEFKRKFRENKDRSSGERSVLLSTIHGVKGLEFKRVFIINCMDEMMGKGSFKSNIEEERRIFYVGITRAIDELYIFYTKKYKGEEVFKSSFIDELECRKNVC